VQDREREAETRRQQNVEREARRNAYIAEQVEIQSLRTCMPQFHDIDFHGNVLHQAAIAQEARDRAYRNSQPAIPPPPAPTDNDVKDFLRSFLQPETEPPTTAPKATPEVLPTAVAPAQPVSAVPPEASPITERHHINHTSVSTTTTTTTTNTGIPAWMLAAMIGYLHIHTKMLSIFGERTHAHTHTCMTNLQCCRLVHVRRFGSGCLP
jgi:hypothetical protein